VTANKTSQLYIISFIERWASSGVAERANYQIFLTELCDHPAWSGASSRRREVLSLNPYRQYRMLGCLPVTGFRYEGCNRNNMPAMH